MRLKISSFIIKSRIFNAFAIVVLGLLLFHIFHYEFEVIFNGYPTFDEWVASESKHGPFCCGTKEKDFYFISHIVFVPLFISGLYAAIKNRKDIKQLGLISLYFIVLTVFALLVFAEQAWLYD